MLVCAVGWALHMLIDDGSTWSPAARDRGMVWPPRGQVRERLPRKSGGSIGTGGASFTGEQGRRAPSFMVAENAVNDEDRLRVWSGVSVMRRPLSRKGAGDPPRWPTPRRAGAWGTTGTRRGVSSGVVGSMKKPAPLFCRDVGVTIAVTSVGIRGSMGAML